MRLTITILFLFIGTQLFGQAHVGLTLTNVNLRTGPSVSDSLILTMPRYSKIHLFSDTVYNDSFFKVKYLEKGQVGYVACKYVHVGDSVLSESQSVLKAFKIKHKQPYIMVENKAGVDVTITIRGEAHLLPSGTKQKIQVSPGTLSVKASAKGILPYEGTETIKEGYGYEWVVVLD